MGGDEIEPAAREHMFRIEAEYAPGQHIQAAKVVQQPAVKPLLLNRRLDRSEIEHGDSPFGSQTTPRGQEREAGIRQRLPPTGKTSGRRTNLSRVVLSIVRTLESLEELQRNRKLGKICL